MVSGVAQALRIGLDLIGTSIEFIPHSESMVWLSFIGNQGVFEWDFPRSLKFECKGLQEIYFEQVVQWQSHSH